MAPAEESEPHFAVRSSHQFIRAGHSGEAAPMLVTVSHTRVPKNEWWGKVSPLGSELSVPAPPPLLQVVIISTV